MKICIIAEGSYPYITGGVSSWIDMLIKGLSEHEFVLYTIFPNEKDKGNHKYVLPSNVIAHTEVFLDSWQNEPVKKRKRIHFTEEERDVIMSLILGRECNWDVLFKMIHDKRVTMIQDFLLSKDFFDIVYSAYVESYSKTPFTEYFWTMRSMLLPLFHIIKHEIPDADVYHCPSAGYAGIVGSLVKTVKNKPLLLTEHGIYTREREIEIIKSNWLKAYYKDMWIEFFYNMSSCVYSKSDRVLTLFNKNKMIQEKLGCPSEKITVIPNGVNVDFFKENMENSAIRYGEGFGGGVVFGAIVRVVPIKDIKTMIQAFSIVKETLTDSKLFILGPYDEDEEYYKECVQTVKDFNIKDVIFTGKVSIKDYMDEIDIFLLSSISEGQPLSVLEAMAAGKANITTDVGCCKELLMNEDDGFGQAGIIVGIMNFEELAHQMINLGSKPDKCLEFGVNGYRRVQERFRLDDMINNYRRIYEGSI